MDNVKQAIAALFNDYIKAFEEFDIQSACCCYALPCLLASPDEIKVIDSDEKLVKAFKEIFDGLKQANFSRAGWRKASIAIHNDCAATVTVPWYFYNQAGEEFASFTGVYQLVKNDQWRIAQVLSHFDVAALPEPLAFDQA